MGVPPVTDQVAPATDAEQSRPEAQERWWRRRIWLPKPVYEALPAIYIVLGAGALASALFMPGWTWILPYMVLLAIGCIHAGIAVSAMRMRRRRADRAATEVTPSPRVCENSPPYDSP